MNNADDEPQKQCPDCTETKPVSEFWRNRATADGLYAYCKPCGRQRNLAAAVKRRAAKGVDSPRARSRPIEDLPPGMKRCLDCKEVLPLDDFVRNRRCGDGRTPYCRRCQYARVAESRQRLHGGSRHYHLSRRYGLGAKDVLARLNRQEWRCPICSVALTEKTAHVDHDHKTGQVRAVLCFNCNGGLGQFKDNPAVLRNAAAYVEGEAWHPIQVAPGVFLVPSSPRALPPSPTSSAIFRLSCYRDDVGLQRVP